MSVCLCLGRFCIGIPNSSCLKQLCPSKFRCKKLVCNQANYPLGWRGYTQCKCLHPFAQAKCCCASKSRKTLPFRKSGIGRCLPHASKKKLVACLQINSTYNKSVEPAFAVPMLAWVKLAHPKTFRSATLGGGAPKFPMIKLLIVVRKIRLSLCGTNPNVLLGQGFSFVLVPLREQ